MARQENRTGEEKNFSVRRASTDLVGGDQEQLGDGRGGGHGVPVDPVDLEGAGHAPHPLVGGEDLLVANQHAVRVFDWRGRRGKHERVNERVNSSACSYVSSVSVTEIIVILYGSQ